VESTYNWYWLVAGLMDHGYPVVLAHPSAIDQYDGIKEADDLTDAAFLARLARLEIPPTGYLQGEMPAPLLNHTLHVTTVTEWTNPSRGARNRRATRGFVSPSARLRLRFGPHHKSCNDSH